MSRSKFEARVAAKELCRRLRRNQTKAESIFWQAVRGRRFQGFKFVRQYPLFHEENGSYSFFIADFYCHEVKLIVELDGSFHRGREDYDRERSEIIRALGIDVLRFRNNEVEQGLPSVISKLEAYFRAHLSNSPHL